MTRVELRIAELPLSVCWRLASSPVSAFLLTNRQTLRISLAGLDGKGVRCGRLVKTTRDREYSFPFVCTTVVSATREQKSRDADPAGLLVTRIGPSKVRSALLDMPNTVLQAPAHRAPHLVLSLAPTSAKPYNNIPNKEQV